LALLGLAICLAFALRLFRLDHQELRGDEAFDALFSVQPVSEIVGQLQTTQPYPPLFHVGLHYWLALAGQSEIAQRSPALISGVLLVPLVYQLASLTFGEATALIAALLAAVNPFYIWHAQDGRMYSLLAVLSAASIWLGLRLLQNRATIWTGLAYWVVTVLALLTHYFAWWLLLAENLAAVLVIWKLDRDHERRKGWRQSLLGHWLAWQGAVVVSLLPWLLAASDLLTSHTSSWIPPLTPLQMLKRSLLTFSVGSTLEPTPTLAFSLAMGTLFVLGCFYPSQPADPAFKGIGRALLLIFAGVPLLATMLLSFKRPAFDEKYLIAIVAPYLILVAHGLHCLGAKWRLAGVAAGIVILAASGWSLYNYHFDPDYAKSPRWRELVQSIGDRAEEGDVIVQNYPDPGLQYYYHGELPVRLLPTDSSSPPGRTGRTLQRLFAVHDRVWFIPGPASAWDPEGSVEQWLRRHGDLVEEQAPGSLRLQLYHTPLTFFEEMQAVDIQAGDRIQLLGYRLTPEAAEPLGPGDRLELSLYWQTLEPMDANYTVFVHLSDPTEHIWGQHDGQPVDGTYPTAEWMPGQIIVDHHPIEISPEAPTGPYRLMTGLYDSITGQRLSISGSSGGVDENRILVATLEVAYPADESGNNQGP
jgi:mannosyltransferase